MRNIAWVPPGKNCGLCGEQSCGAFLRALREGATEPPACPYYQETSAPRAEAPSVEKATSYTGLDVLGHAYDFVLAPLAGELSARKIVLPFRSDLPERLGIVKGDFVLGRPMGAGCPIPHVLQVIEADYTTGLLYTWVMGPRRAREGKVHDVTAYHMIGFEGLATRIAKEPAFGGRVSFLPGFCMMQINHTGLVNMVLAKTDGLHVRIEDIRILAPVDNSPKPLSMAEHAN